jgi:DNA-binding LytR/AlgR family response regulator
MKVVIIEDENRAANRIERLLNEVFPEANILCKLESIRESLVFLNENSCDLIISDIQLADGLSFDIYKQVEIGCPIIFTTAYDQYAIEAFETNGVDYLLKPIEKYRLQKAIEKVKKLQPKVDVEQLMSLFEKKSSSSYKSRFMIRVGDKIKSIPVEDISLFYSFEKGTFLHTRENRNYLLDQSLDALHPSLNPDAFFRISRKYIVCIDAVNEIIAHTNSRLKLKIKGFEDDDIIVARERVKQFKSWLDQ